MYSFIPIFLAFLLWGEVKAADTTCEQSQKLFADLCFSPSPTLDIDFQWLKENQPPKGWYAELGNDVMQLHVSELIKGELLDSKKDNFKDMCMRIKFEHDEGKAKGDGEFFGYDNLYANWTCKASKDFPGADRCEFKSALTKYGEDDLSYINYMDKNYIFAFNCFPNGQVGWTTLSNNPKLSDEDRKAVHERAASLGFPSETNTINFQEHCAK